MLNITKKPIRFTSLSFKRVTACLVQSDCRVGAGYGLNNKCSTMKDQRSVHMFHPLNNITASNCKHCIQYHDDLKSYTSTSSFNEYLPSSCSQ